MPLSPSVPFYSSQVHEALVEIISNHEERVDGPASLASADDHLPSSFTTIEGTAIRGKWTEGYESSSSTDDDADNNAGSDDDDSSTTSSRSLLEAVEENQPTATADANRQGKGKQHGKKSKNKKSKDGVLQKMGKAPSILLPFDVTNNDNAKKKKKNSSALANRKALEIPNVLLPTNYLRDNPNWKVSSVAKTLLSTWDQLSSNNNHDNSASSSSSNNPPTILVVLLQSGRFAAAAFSLQQNQQHPKSTPMKMLAHKTSTRYTVRKGQGGSQSSHDQSKNKANSIGAQLRREGEKQLRGDVQGTWKEWKRLGYVQRAMWVYVSCPKGMRRDYLFDDDAGGGLLGKSDDRFRSVPLDVGKPTMDATAAVLECVLSCSVREMTQEEKGKMEGLAVVDDTWSNGKESTTKDVGANDEKKGEMKESSEESANAVVEVEVPSLTPLHEAVLDGDLPRLIELLKLLDETEELVVDDPRSTDQSTPVSFGYDVNTAGGVDHQTPLHLASYSSHPNATSLLNALLIQGHANPCALDTRGRPPYFLASSDKHREAFRLARGTLGEEYCPWDDDAKVGPSLSEADVQLKNAKAQEKKRRQRARQKEKKANEKTAAAETAAKEREELEKKKQEEDAKRTRDGLKPKTSAATNVCDFCQKVMKGKRRSQMFQRLEYAYCSTECVKRHQRELMAAAATSRMG
eukprot:CAMPEP_0172308292 /NCGR_PEP_ID=MMETSP1058-20130122/8937_1 /TAXON_ID=83371 /ORGANISM="Detonula confervacea, Strain CCMP 353" /LENGTH=688 /DNA_ID=CAMNT_0013020675 /DNA_START=38 /DNA_END=2104 /DNA_ORIENTATION=-